MTPVNSMKIPTGGFGDYAINIESLATHLKINNGFATDEELTQALSTKSDKVDTYTKTEVDTAFSGFVNKTQSETTANLSNSTSTINTVDKYIGKFVFNSTDGLLYFSTGSTTTDVWRPTNGSSDIIPI